jgi:hypothetical protein
MVYAGSRALTLARSDDAADGSDLAVDELTGEGVRALTAASRLFDCERVVEVMHQAAHFCLVVHRMLTNVFRCF